MEQDPVFYCRDNRYTNVDDIYMNSLWIGVGNCNGLDICKMFRNHHHELEKIKHHQTNIRSDMTKQARFALDTRNSLLTLKAQFDANKNSQQIINSAVAQASSIDKKMKDLITLGDKDFSNEDLKSARKLETTTQLLPNSLTDEHYVATYSDIFNKEIATTNTSKYGTIHHSNGKTVVVTNSVLDENQEACVQYNTDTGALRLAAANRIKLVNKFAPKEKELDSSDIHSLSPIAPIENKNESLGLQSIMDTDKLQVSLLFLLHLGRQAHRIHLLSKTMILNQFCLDRATRTRKRSPGQNR